MHTLKEKLWSELEMLSMQEKSRTEKGLDMDLNSVILIKETAEAYVYLCKAEKLHHEYKNEHKTAEKVHKPYEHPVLKKESEEEGIEQPKMFQ